MEDLRDAFYKEEKSKFVPVLLKLSATHLFYWLIEINNRNDIVHRYAIYNEGNGLDQRENLKPVVDLIAVIFFLADQCV